MMRCVSASCSSKMPDIVVCDDTDDNTVPAGTATSCAVTRICSPARNSVPVTATSTSASLARRLRSIASPASFTAAIGERTMIERIAASDVVIASGIAVARKAMLLARLLNALLVRDRIRLAQLREQHRGRGDEGVVA